MLGTMIHLATRFVLGETEGFANELRMSAKMFRLQSTPLSRPITVVKNHARPSCDHHAARAPTRPLRYHVAKYAGLPPDAIAKETTMADSTETINAMLVEFTKLEGAAARKQTIKTMQAVDRSLSSVNPAALTAVVNRFLALEGDTARKEAIKTFQTFDRELSSVQSEINDAVKDAVEKEGKEREVKEQERIDKAVAEALAKDRQERGNHTPPFPPAANTVPR